MGEVRSIGAVFLVVLTVVSVGIADPDREGAGGSPAPLTLQARIEGDEVFVEGEAAFPDGHPVFFRFLAVDGRVAGEAGTTVADGRYAGRIRPRSGTIPLGEWRAAAFTWPREALRMKRESDRVGAERVLVRGTPDEIADAREAQWAEFSRLFQELDGIHETVRAVYPLPDGGDASERWEAFREGMDGFDRIEEWLRRLEDDDRLFRKTDWYPDLTRSGLFACREIRQSADEIGAEREGRPATIDDGQGGKHPYDRAWEIEIRLRNCDVRIDRLLEALGVRSRGDILALIEDLETLVRLRDHWIQVGEVAESRGPDTPLTPEEREAGELWNQRWLDDVFRFRDGGEKYRGGVLDGMGFREIPERIGEAGNGFAAGWLAGHRAFCTRLGIDPETWPSRRICLERLDDALEGMTVEASAAQVARAESALRAVLEARRQDTARTVEGWERVLTAGAEAALEALDAIGRGADPSPEMRNRVGGVVGAAQRALLDAYGSDLRILFPEAEREARKVVGPLNALNRGLQGWDAVEAADRERFRAAVPQMQRVIRESLESFRDRLAEFTAASE